MTINRYFCCKFIVYLHLFKTFVGMKRLRIVLSVMALWVFLLGNSQSEYPLGFQAEVGYLVGGQVTSNTFAYQSGLSARVVFVKPVRSDFLLGLGVGLDTYDYINFVPVFLKIEARRTSDKTGAFVAYVGYSFADEESGGAINQEFEGGGFLEVGRSWRYSITEDSNFLFGLTLKHQFATSEIENLVDQELEEKTDFDGIHFRIGVSF